MGKSEDEGRWVGQPLLRREDPSLLTGASRYLADLADSHTLHVGFVRSDLAHADIVSIDGSQALARPGVVAFFTAEDLAAENRVAETLLAQPSTHDLWTKDTPYYALAKGRVRHVGEAIAAVVATSATELADALEHVEVEFRELPIVIDTVEASRPGSPTVYADWSDNVVGTFEVAMGDVDAAEAAADVTVSDQFRINRQTAASLEPRGVLAEWDGRREELVVWTSTQSPHIVLDFVSEVTGLPTSRVTVRVPQVGGGFGAKFHYYPEESALALIAMRLGRTVMWVEGRSESFVATVHARDLVVDVTMTASADGKMSSMRVGIVADLGAYTHMVSYGPSWLTAVMMTNVYVIPNAKADLTAIVTNKTPAGSYRGWGQPEANFVVERMVELLAAELGIDSIELRRRNLIAPHQFPYTSLFHTFDNGEYEMCLDNGLELGQYERWKTRQAEGRLEGLHIGIGISFYVENTALGPSRQMNEGGLNQGGYDISHVRMEQGGDVTVFTGLCEMGQGFTNGLAQMCAETLGVRPEQVNVVTGDTNRCPYTGHGTGASRSAAVGGAAVRKASLEMKVKVGKIAAHMLEAAEGDLVHANGVISVRGTPGKRVTTADVGRAAYLRAIDLPPGVDPGLEVVVTHDPDAMAWPYGLNMAVVQVDPETCGVELLAFSVFHDCGTILNPMIVDGQIHGGTAQGIGAALFEELTFDDQGQPQSGSFLNYLVPSAVEVPNFTLGHMIHPSPVVPGGMKGVGEAGIIGPPAAVIAAIEDALYDHDVRFTSIPLTPAKIFDAIQVVQST